LTAAKRRLAPPAGLHANHPRHDLRGSRVGRLTIDGSFVVGAVPGEPAKRAFCKTVGSACVGSNPTPVTAFLQVKASDAGWFHRLSRPERAVPQTVGGHLHPLPESLVIHAVRIFSAERE
jgi:hypothetical protein